MPEGQKCQNLLLAMILGGLVACGSDKDAAGATSPEGSSSKHLGVDTAGQLSPRFVGEWVYHDSSIIGHQKWQVKMKEDGLYVTCEVLQRTNGARIDTIEPFVCDSGTWTDLGDVTLAYGKLDSLVVDPDRNGAIFNAARLVMVDWKHPMDALRTRLDHPGGFLFSRSGDSLVNVGHFEIFQGAGRRFDSTLWCHPGGAIDSLFLSAKGIADAKVLGVSGKKGQWVSDSRKIDVSFVTETSPDGSPTRYASVGGRVGYLGSHLIMLEIRAPAGFQKVSGAGQ